MLDLCVFVCLLAVVAVVYEWTSPRGSGPWLLLFLLIAIPSHADHRKLTAVPRGIGRTTRNMVTFRDKQAAIEEWLCLASPIADGLVSEHVLRTIPSSYEANGLFGHHPGYGTYLAILVPIGMYGSVGTQWGHEMLDGTKKHWELVLPAAISLGVHSGAIAWNEHEIRVTCSQAGITCR